MLDHIFLSVSNTDRSIAFYNLDMIISVGYRVNSRVGTQFRMWATQRLTQFVTKGFVLNEEKLSQGGSEFDELLAKVRQIRTSEKNFYDKVRDLFATSTDYDSSSIEAREFFSTVQNKLHYAIHGYTAAEIILNRVDANHPTMGLTNWSGQNITKQEACVAKNYLIANELKRLELLVEQFLSYAELKVLENQPMTMAGWCSKVDDFLRFNDKAVLTHAGTVSNKDMQRQIVETTKQFNLRTLKSLKP